jgi:hypothetical protein
MEPLLWTLEQIAGFITHADKPVRRWAAERVTKLFPEQAAGVLVAQLDDSDTYLALRAAEVIGQSGDAARFGPIVLEHLQRAPQVGFAVLAEAAAQLNLSEALPLIVARMRQKDTPFDTNELLRLVRALGRYGQAPAAREALWEAFTDNRVQSLWGGAVIEALLSTPRPEELPRLVEAYRALPYNRRHLSAFGGPAGAHRPIDETGYVLSQGFEAVVARIGDWLGQYLPVSPETRGELREAFSGRRANIFSILLREAQRLTHQRGDDIAGWQAAWAAGEPLTGYRLEAVYTLALLEVFAAAKPVFGEQRQAEAAMGLALLGQLGIDRDDQGCLDAATNELIVLLSILADNRENILPDVLERLVAIGPTILPGLTPLLKPDQYGWGLIHALHVVTRLARRYPGSCDVMAPLIIETMYEGQGDYAMEAASEALEAIGLAAVAPMIQHLNDGDSSRYIYLTGTLGNIPTQASAQALLDQIPPHEQPEEMEVVNFADTGSAIGIAPLYKLSKRYPDDPVLAESLLVLCELNGVTRPELPHWRDIVAAEDARVAKIIAGPGKFPSLEQTQEILTRMGMNLAEADIKAMFDLGPSPEPEEPRPHARPLEALPPPQPARKQMSRQERKRRKEQRKRTRRQR